jgi:hypothetical protein
MPVKAPNVNVSRKLKSPAATPQAIFFADRLGLKDGQS